MRVGTTNDCYALMTSKPTDAAGVAAVERLLLLCVTG